MRHGKHSCQRKLPDNLVDIHPPKVDKTGHPQTLSGEQVKYTYITPRLYITTVNVIQSNRYILCLKFSTTEEARVEGDSNHLCLFLITLITLRAFTCRYYDIVKALRKYTAHKYNCILYACIC